MVLHRCIDLYVEQKQEAAKQQNTKLYFKNTVDQV